MPLSRLFMGLTCGSASYALGGHRSPKACVLVNLFLNIPISGCPRHSIWSVPIFVFLHQWPFSHVALSREGRVSEKTALKGIRPLQIVANQWQCRRPATRHEPIEHWLGNCLTTAVPGWLNLKVALRVILKEGIREADSQKGHVCAFALSPSENCAARRELR